MNPDPEIQLISPSRLTCDRSVQRGLNMVRVAKMARNYNEHAVGVIIVSDRGDGVLHIIDGQHRVAVVTAVGRENDPLMCLVHKGLTRAEEALMFRVYNEMKAPHIVEKFRVRVIERDETAVLLNQLLNTQGWTVTQSKNAGCFSAVGALENVYKGGRKQEESISRCEMVLDIATSAWGHNPHGVRAELISGIGALVARHETELDVAKLITELAQLSGGPLALLAQSKSLWAIRAGKLSDSMAEILVNKVNKSRRVNRLPEWRSS